MKFSLLCFESFYVRILATLVAAVLFTTNFEKNAHMTIIFLILTNSGQRFQKHFQMEMMDVILSKLRSVSDWLNVKVECENVVLGSRSESI